MTTRFKADEIEAVLAHKLGHHVPKDLPYGILVQSVLTLVGFWLAHSWVVTSAPSDSGSSFC